MRIPTLLVAAAVVLGAGPVLADSPPPEGLQPVPEPPEVPARVQSGEVLEPDVRIVHEQKRTVTEYRVGGQLRAVKIQPEDGPPYYLVDADGDGNLETRTRGLGPNFAIPQWVLFSW